MTPERFVLVGRSLGSGVAVEVARRGHGRGLVLLSPFTSVVEAVRGFVGPLATLVVQDRFDSIAKIGELSLPIVVIHGMDDGLVPFAHGERLVAAARDARLVPLPGVGHDDLGDLGAHVGRAIATIP